MESIGCCTQESTDNDAHTLLAASQPAPRVISLDKLRFRGLGSPKEWISAPASSSASESSMDAAAG